MAVNGVPSSGVGQGENTRGSQCSSDHRRRAIGKGNPHPLTEAGIFSKIFFCWMFKFFRIGYKRPLVEEDLYEVLPEDSSAVLAKSLEREWNKELEKAKKSGKPPSLLMAVLRTFGWTYMLYGIPAFLEETVFKIAQPLMLSRLVLYFSTDAVSTTEAYLQAAGISAVSLLVSACHHTAFFGFERMGMRLRIACSSLIFRKALRQSHLAMGETTVGQLVNILSNDVNRFDLAFSFLHYLWIAPIQLVIVAVLTWREVGVACLAGLSFLVLLAPLQLYTGKLFSKLRAETALLSDARIRIMNEVITGIAVVKIYAWEKPFRKLVFEARRKEIGKIMHSAYLRALSLALVFSIPLLTSFTTFMVYAALGNPVTSTKVFPVLALFFAARLCLTVFFAFGIMNGSEGLVSIRRIQDFLMMEELETQPLNTPSGRGTRPRFSIQEADIDLDELHHMDNGRDSSLDSDERSSVHGSASVVSRITGDDDESPAKSTSWPVNSETTVAEYLGPAAFGKDLDEPDELVTNGKIREPGIVVQHLSCSWTKDVTNAVLQDISFRVKPGELLAVIGTVGCGKSSLLMALLGELPTLSGVKVLTGQVGYAAQQPWILSGSLRENILFGSQYQHARYRRIIKMCALKRDMELLSNGDQTLVGERGVTLSGGQRARVSLARALYRDADVYLLDDPLSAVDPGVARHLFQKCILKHLCDKPRILVTHQLQFLDKVDTILIIDQGRVSDYGTYLELQARGVNFETLLKTEGLKDGNSQFISFDSTLGQGRKKSVVSIMSATSEIDEDDTPVEMEAEEMEEGTVGWRVYFRFLRAAAGLLFMLVWAVIIIGAQGMLAMTDVWLAQWANEEENQLHSMNVTNQGNVTFTDEIQSYYIRIYAILSPVTVVLVFLRGFLFFYMFVTASKSLHNQMFQAIIRAPMHFFETNPVGRVLNRFAKDIGLMDDVLPVIFTDFLQIGIHTISTVIVISIFNPFCLAFTVPILLLFVVTRRYYLASSRVIKRLEAVARSPVFSHLSATLAGISTVRAFRAQERFTEAFDGYQDGHTRAWFLFLATSRWFGVQLDFLTAIFISGVSFTCVVAAGLLGLNSGIVGLSLTYAINLMGGFQWAVRQSAELENQMTSVERVCQYVDIPSEAPLKTATSPPPDWPSEGRMEFHNVSLSYSEDSPAVLDSISLTVKANEKIGIVGRTGAGKSSLMLLLMRLAEPTGTVLIDGVDIATIGLHDLRKKIAFIPQEPVLFSGTLRKNLDPFDKHTDFEIWGALVQVQLKAAIEELPSKLEHALTEGGSNFSVGQRQLLCLARAILRKNKILIVDEATANVDVRTDQLIQEAIRKCFLHCTVLTIAHRLNTLMDSDRIMVLDAGRLVEFDEPYILLQRTGSRLATMVQETGRAETAKLLQMAREKYHERNTTEPYNKPVG